MVADHLAMPAEFFSTIVPPDGRVSLPRQWVGRTVTVTEEKLTRSQKANRYYWGVVLDMASLSCGQSVDDIHDAMCAKFLPNERKRIDFVNTLTGEVEAVEIDPRRSSKLKRVEFYDFVELVREWVRDFLGVDTPQPDTDYWRKR